MLDQIVFPFQLLFSKNKSPIHNLMFILFADNSESFFTKCLFLIVWLENYTEGLQIYAIIKKYNL